MSTTAPDILERIQAQQRRTVVVVWNGPSPDLTKESWAMCVTNEEPERWAALDRGLTSHFVFDLDGIEHAKRLYTDLCVHFAQPDQLAQFNVDDVHTGRRMFFLVKVTLGRG